MKTILKIRRINKLRRYFPKLSRFHMDQQIWDSMEARAKKGEKSIVLKIVREISPISNCSEIFLISLCNGVETAYWNYLDHTQWRHLYGKDSIQVR